jgi:hypothetical protein
MSARITLVFLALVVGIACLTATHAGPPTADPDGKPTVATAEKHWYTVNYGRIARLYPSPGGVYFVLVSGQTAMEPRSGYYHLNKGHPNYEATYDLLYRAAEKRWRVQVNTEPELNEYGYALVEYLIVDFPE